jgi:ATP-dependent Zn protease
VIRGRLGAPEKPKQKQEHKQDRKQTARRRRRKKQNRSKNKLYYLYFSYVFPILVFFGFVYFCYLLGPCLCSQIGLAVLE